LGTHTDFDDLARAREETQAARRRSELLAEASQVMSSTLDQTEALERLSRVITGTFADACVIDAIDPDDEHAGRREPAVVAHADAAKGTALEVWWRGRVAVRGALPRALRDGTAQLLRELDDATLTRLGDRGGGRGGPRELGLLSAIVVPIRGVAGT